MEHATIVRRGSAQTGIQTKTYICPPQVFTASEPNDHLLAGPPASTPFFQFRIDTTPAATVQQASRALCQTHNISAQVCSRSFHVRSSSSKHNHIHSWTVQLFDHDALMRHLAGQRSFSKQPLQARSYIIHEHGLHAEYARYGAIFPSSCQSSSLLCSHTLSSLRQRDPDPLPQSCGDVGRSHDRDLGRTALF